MVWGRATLVPVETYLSTPYDPDCDYVDGVLEERNAGEKDHSKLQGNLYVYLRHHFEKFYTAIEQRIRVAPARFRVPDLCVYTQEPAEQILVTPPFLCVEILSPEDRMSRMQEKIEDYLKFGVRFVWLIDPRSKRAEIHTNERSEEGLFRVLSG